jgi:hypothetical protein
MKIKCGLLLACTLLIGAVKLSAQDFNVPKNYSLKYTIDYATYQPDVIKCIDWLENSPLDKDNDKHTEAFKFLLKWIDGAPNVHVNIIPDFVMKNKKNYALFVIYMGEWSRYEIKNGDKANPKEAAMAAIKAEIKVYQKGNGLVKDKTIDKLIDLEAKGKLEKFIADNLPKEGTVLTPVRTTR